MSNPPFPNTRPMLPSEARAAVTSHLIARLEASPLDCYGNSLYTYANAVGEPPADVDGYTWTILRDCWDAALERYNTLHPITWNYDDPRDTKKYREGINGQP